MHKAVNLCSIAGALLLAGCATVPRDAGFNDVRSSVIAVTHQPVEWDPQKAIQPPNDSDVAPLLQGELTADRAVEIAFRNNRDLLATLERLGLARADLIAASTIRNPVLDAEIRFPGRPARPFELAVTQTVLDLLQFRARRQFGLAQYEAARVQITGAIINFAAQVRMNYYDLLAGRRILARQDAIMKAQEASTELARRQHAAGNISDLDLENEQALYEETKLEYATAQLEELQARERLTADLGLLNRAELNLPQDFPAVPANEMTAAEVEQQVMTARMDVRAAQQQLAAAQRALPLARTAVFEDLTVGIHHEREPEGTKTTGPSLALPIPIFNWAAAQRTRAIAMVRESQQRLGAITVTARSEARAAYERVLEARQRTAYFHNVIIPRRTRILALTQQEYNAMIRGVYQLIQARQNLSSAEREQIMAVRDYWIARTDLETALQGVAPFSVRPEQPRIPRPDLFRPMDQQASKTNESER